MTFLLITKKSRSRKAWEWWIEETSRGTFQFCSNLASATYKKDPCALEREADSAFHSFPSSSLILSLFVSVGSKNPFSEYVIVATEISQISSLKAPSWLYLHIFLRFFFKRQQTSRSKFRYKWTQTPVLLFVDICFWHTGWRQRSLRRPSKANQMNAISSPFTSLTTSKCDWWWAAWVATSLSNYLSCSWETDQKQVHSL